MSDSSRPEPLSDEDARQLAEQLAMLTKSGMPLAPGLRAAAAEMPNRRLATAMSTLADELQAGRSLQHILATNPRFLPPHMTRLIEAGVRSGSLPEVLVQLVDIDRTSADLRRSVRLAIAYPVLLVVLWMMLAVFLAMYVMPGMKQIYDDFKTTLPWPTTLLMSFSGEGALRAFVFFLAAVTMLIVGLRVSLRPFGWQRLLVEIPWVGPTLLWRGVANWSRLLALLLRQQIPLPEATKLAADGVHAPIMTVAGLRTSKMIDGGRKLADALAQIRSVPASLVPLVRWGEDHGTLPEALDSAAEMFENRVQLRATLLRSVLPPVTFIVIALGALGLVNAMMLPLVKLITDLSSGGRKGGGPTFGITPGAEADALRTIGTVAAVWLIMSLVVWLRRTALGSFLTRLAGDGDLSDESEPVFWTVFRCVYWIFSFAILFVVMAGIAGVFGCLLWIAAVVITLMIIFRSREMDRRALLWMLAIAVEKGIPLGAAVRGFAAERRDRLGGKLRYLGQLSDRGVRPDVALAQAEISLPDDALVAVRTGVDSRSLAVLLKGAARSAASLDASVHAAIARLVYLVVFVVITAFLIAFMAIRILPAYQKIFEDFKTTLPPVTVAMITTLHTFASTTGVILLWVFVGLVALMLFTLARYIGLIYWDPPIARQFAMPLDEAIVLRSLAAAVEAERPLSNAVALLARAYPKPYIRSRLREASRRISDGEHWCESLHASGLLPASEAGLLKAAERVGNLAWAMNESAQRLTRRFSTRLTTLVSIGFPIVVLLFSIVVGFVAVGMIFPVAKLISGLSGP